MATLRSLLLALACLPLTAVAAPPAGGPALAIVLVIDGLRPDSITPDVMPNLDRLRRGGVSYTRSHSVYPTVTRVNAASISTGLLPGHHGIVGNSLYLPSFAPRPMSNGDYQVLLNLAKINGGRVVIQKTLGEYFADAGVHYVALSSGSTGNATLLNPTAVFGKGELISPGFEKDSRVAFPDALNAELLSKYGKEKGDSGNPSLVWTERVLREYVLEKMHPDVIVDWMDQPDVAQHEFGVGSPEALTALRLVDQQIGLLLARLKELALDGKTDIIVTCDHGFDYDPAADLVAPIRDAGLSDDVAVDNEGGSNLFYVKGHDAAKIELLAAKFQAASATNAVFVAAARPAGGSFTCTAGAEKGFAPGTFALELAGDCMASHGPDMIVTWHWDDAGNPFGVAGTQSIQGRPVEAGKTAHSGHGSLNPYTTHSVLVATGPHFGSKASTTLPAGNLDIMPTLLALEGLPVPSGIDGRVLSEAMKSKSFGPALKAQTRRIEASAGSFCSELQVSYAGEHRYLDLARRCGGK